MGIPIINGTGGAQLQNVSVSFDPVRGRIVHYHYTSPGNGVQGIIAVLESSGIAYEADINDHISHLTATLTSASNQFGESVQDHWQLAANVIQEDIKLHPRTVAMEAAYPGTLSKVLAAVESHNAGGGLTASFTSGATTVDEALALYNFMIRGGTHYQRGQYVFKWTTYVSFNSTAWRAGGEGIAIMSGSDVISISRPPAAIVSAMDEIPTPSIGDSSDVAWGWLRQPTTRTTGANNRIEISTEWWQGLWSTFAYREAS